MIFQVFDFHQTYPFIKRVLKELIERKFYVLTKSLDFLLECVKLLKNVRFVVFNRESNKGELNR